MSSVLPIPLFEPMAVADFPRRADLLGQEFEYNDATLGPIRLRLVKAGETLTSPACWPVAWTDDDLGVYSVEASDAATERPCGVCLPDQVTLAAGDLFYVIVEGRCKLKNLDGQTITAGSFAICTTTDGLVGDGGSSVTQGVDFARMVEAFTGNGQTKVAELLHKLVG